MTQALKWLGIIAVVLLMLVVLAVLILTPLANRRQQAFRPLSHKTLQQVLSSADSIMPRTPEFRANPRLAAALG